MVELGIDINWLGAFSTMMFYTGYALLIMLIMGSFAAIYYYMGFKISANVIPIYGGGEGSSLAPGKAKRNRFKWVAQRTRWKPLYPLFNKLEVEPFDNSLIYPGNKVIAFKYGDKFIPGRIKIFQDNDQLSTSLSPVPYYVRNWESLAYQRNRNEFSELSFFQENKYFIMVVATAAICLAAVVATAYLSYKFAGAGRADIQGLTSAIRDFGVIPSK